MLKLINGSLMSELWNMLLSYSAFLCFIFLKTLCIFNLEISTTTCYLNIYCAIYGEIQSMHQLVPLVGDQIQTL
jgi:hypothetical protein